MSSNEAMLNHDMHMFYSNFLDLMRDDQLMGCEVMAAINGDAVCPNPALAAGSIGDVTPFTTVSSPAASGA